MPYGSSGRFLRFSETKNPRRDSLSSCVVRDFLQKKKTFFSFIYRESFKYSLAPKKKLQVTNNLFEKKKKTPESCSGPSFFLSLDESIVPYGAESIRSILIDKKLRLSKMGEKKAQPRSSSGIHILTQSTQRPIYIPFRRPPSSLSLSLVLCLSRYTCQE